MARCQTIPEDMRTRHAFFEESLDLALMLGDFTGDEIMFSSDLVTLFMTVFGYLSCIGWRLGTWVLHDWMVYVLMGLV